MKIFLYVILLCFSPFLAHAGDLMLQREKVETYLNNIHDLRAGFEQKAPDETLASGDFYLKRPGKMRWEYNPPTPILMVTRGDYLTYYDYDLDQVSDIPIEDTLLRLLAEENLTFSDELIEILDEKIENGIYSITIAQKEKPGSLTLYFSVDPQQWLGFTVMDATAQETQVSLDNIQTDITLEEGVFAFTDPRVGGRRKKY